MAAQGKVLHGWAGQGPEGGIRVLRLVGEVRHPMSSVLERLIESSFEPSAPPGFVVDVREATVIDSTSLGLLATIASRMRSCGGRRVTLVSNRLDMNELLTSMGFDRVFDMVADSPVAPMSWEELVAPEPGSRESASLVLRAHRVLMALDPKNEQSFRELVRLLEEKLGDQPSSR